MSDKEGEVPIIVQPAGRDGEPPAEIPGSTWVPYSEHFSQEEIEERNLRPSKYKLVRNEDDSDEKKPVSSLFKTLPFDKMRRDFENAGEHRKGSQD